MHSMDMCIYDTDMYQKTAIPYLILIPLIIIFKNIPHRAKRQVTKNQ